MSLDTLLRQGALVRLRFTRAARVTLRLRVSAATARRAGVPRTIARARVRVRPCRRVKTVVLVPRDVATRLRSLERRGRFVRVTLRAAGKSVPAVGST